MDWRKWLKCLLLDISWLEYFTCNQCLEQKIICIPISKKTINNSFMPNWATWLLMITKREKKHYNLLVLLKEFICHYAEVFQFGISNIFPSKGFWQSSEYSFFFSIIEWTRIGYFNRPGMVLTPFPSSMRFEPTTFRSWVEFANH